MAAGAQEFAEGLGLHLFSSPLDDTAVDLLEAMDVPATRLPPLKSWICRSAQDRKNRQAHHLVHRDGDAGRDRRSDRDDSEEWATLHRATKVYKRVPCAA